MNGMNTDKFPKLTEPMTQASLCDDLEAFCKLHKLPFASADELMRTDEVDEDQKGWLSEFVDAWDRLMEQPGEDKLTLRTPMELAGAFLGSLREVIAPEQFDACIAGRLDPDDVCDSNVVMASAFLKLHRREVILPSQVEEGLFGEDEAEAERLLWNEAVSLLKANGVGMGQDS